ncbi:hypothetical protein PK28_10730 [Hymenobacter sp. DG25B]|uniref:hypothetical protein n=1 Tax=Hymenobacter sp. DG25B TaxID=1385664 RepID=UPI000540C7E4|nr:hypothetical protein [Hymenobacter sp. DG25B]AIZ64055.1 hypothetical protein PK28_10730 [Hymenobacter sp. DG25B]
MESQTLIQRKYYNVVSVMSSMWRIKPGTETSRVLMLLGNEQLKKTAMLSLPKHLNLWLTPNMATKR